MPHNEDDKGKVIPIDQIRETSMPPYEYQKPQNGFGSIGDGQSQNLDQDIKNPDSKVENKYRP